MENIKGKAKLVALALASLTSICNSIEAYASESSIRVAGSVKKDTLHIKALEDVEVKENIVNGTTVGTLREGIEIPFNMLLDSGYYEVHFNGKVGYVEADKVEVVYSYNAEHMVEFINNAVLYTTDNRRIELEDRQIGKLLKVSDNWSMVETNGVVGYVNSDNTRVLSDCFVVVEKSEQLGQFYQGAELLFESPVITGKDKSPTDSGDYEVYAKVKNCKMVGADYVSYADYCVKFNEENKEYLHSASWRSDDEFKDAKKIQKNQGSHGCVNCPDYFAWFLYEYCTVGDDVIVR